jgi:diguanylate cyclase (GGDEF)-like protein
MARVRRSGEPLSVIVMDVDGLKQVNDSEGHAAGDALLRGVSACWASILRETDYLGRLGGDEFAVILEGADEREAKVVLERLRDVLQAGESASGGLAAWDRAEDAGVLVARADARMYVDKRGRGGARPAALRLVDDRLAS